MPPAVPPETIEAGELTLCRERVEHAEALAATVAENLDELRPWMQWARPEAGTTAYQRRRLLATRRKWRRGPDYSYVLIHGVSGELVGACGLHRRVGPGGIEIGYWVDRHHWGRGYATAAAAALTDVALALPDVDRVEIHTDEANTRSRRIPERLGYRLDRVDEREPVADGETDHNMIWVREQTPDS